ncbi:MAG: Gldg family protein [Planctomycetes bacterium]|nr:Gldg family protein [Planctomycetota bacterium]
MRTLTTSLLGLVVLAVLFFAVNLVGGMTLSSARLDLTEAKLYTLSQGTKNILAGIQDPVTLRLFYSKKLASKEAEGLERYAQRVTELLQEYEARSNGKLTLLQIDPEPFSEEEDLAAEFGMRGVPVNQAGERIYFGIAGTNTTDGEATIPFVELPRENFLEYDFTKLVYSLGYPQKRKVGLITSLPVNGAPGNPMLGSRGTPPWLFMDQVRDAFDVVEIERDATELPADVDILLLVHPKGLNDQLLFRIDQFALNGGKVLAFLDPHCDADTEGINPQDQMSAFSANRTSDLGPLTDAWGFELVLEKLAADREHAERVAINSGDAPYPIWLNLPAELFNPDDPVTADLKKIRMATPGVLRPVDGAATSFERLIWTGKESMEVDRMKVVMGHSPSSVETILNEFVPLEQELVLAARVSGDIKTAYPDGPPEPVAVEGETPPPAPVAPAGGWKQVGKLQCIVVADADMLADNWWVRVMDFLGQRIAQPNANNADLVINALDNLSGNEDLIALRSRQSFERPFTRVEKMRDDADARFREEEQALQTELENAQKKIDELQTTQEGAVSSLILTPEARAEIERYRQVEKDTRKKLRDVKHSLTKDIEALGTRLKVLHIVLLPFALVLSTFAAYFLLAGRKRS